MRICALPRCTTELPMGSRDDRLYCTTSHRVMGNRERRDEALTLFILGTRLRTEGCDDVALLADIDARLSALLAHRRI